MTFPETDRERLWTALVGGAVVVLVLGSVLLPDVVYAQFIWQYFWGPVYADAHGAQCVAWANGAQQLGATWNACAQYAGPVAHPGYTVVSEIGYAVTLIALLSGVVFLLDRLDVGESFGLLWAVSPFLFFGGALRVVEDADNALRGTSAVGIEYPLNVLFISPIIYFTVFAVTLVALVASVWLARRAVIERYEHGVVVSGAVLLGLCLLYLTVLAVQTERVEFHPVFTVLTVGVSVACTAAIWWLTERFWPAVNAGTGYVGAFAVFAHAVDGVANVVALDWGQELGLASDLYPKHPVNQFVVDVAGRLQPAWLTHYIGDAWPFLGIKLVAAVLVVWLFNDEMLEDSPRFTVLLVVAIVAVGLGPGTRDMLRATFGV